MERRKRASDRRKTERITATFAVKESVGAKVHLCLAEDIGPLGMTIRRPKGITYLPRTPVALAFELPGSKQEIAARGVIVNESSAGRYQRSGVRFITLRPEHQALIAAYCRRSG